MDKTNTVVLGCRINSSGEWTDFGWECYVNFEGDHWHLLKCRFPKSMIDKTKDRNPIKENIETENALFKEGTDLNLIGKISSTSTPVSEICLDVSAFSFV